MKPQLAVVACVAILLMAAGQPVAAQTMDGAVLFDQNCKTCHDPSLGQPPDKSYLVTRRPDQIVAALTTGPMQMMQAFLNPAQIQAVAAYLGTPAPAAASAASPPAAGPVAASSK
jgi:mono/diheme cytochrome c family protein